MYISTISPSEIGVICTNLSNQLGHHLVEITHESFAGEASGAQGPTDSSPKDLKTGRSWLHLHPLEKIGHNDHPNMAGVASGNST